MCPCEDGSANWQFEEQRVGCDETQGRYADVDINRCCDCGWLWLRYFVEYEAFTGSGRWARCLISADDAANITPETAAGYLENAEWYICGGSYYFGRTSRGTGRLHWGI